MMETDQDYLDREPFVGETPHAARERVSRERAARRRDRQQSQRHSRCATCTDTITIAAAPGQRWDDVEWQHDSGQPTDGHAPEPELRFTIDRDCPRCAWPEIGCVAETGQLVCSVCEWSSDDEVTQ